MREFSFRFFKTRSGRTRAKLTLEPQYITEDDLEILKRAALLNDMTVRDYVNQKCDLGMIIMNAQDEIESKEG